jgi:DNA helicase-2/ATP-dependent DNA helicase PcrA
VVAATNHLTLAVAGSRKTQGIVDACAAAATSQRILILTYTTANQMELRRRLAEQAGDRPNVEVMGWFTFLIGNFVRPFLPYTYRGRRVGGFDFKSPPQQYASLDSWNRYFNTESEIRKVHLPQLAHRLEVASSGAGIRRLERVYDRIFVDEVQDLCGYDLEILKLLMASDIPLEMVGDVRQAILATNEREKKNKKFMFMGIWAWFLAEAKVGRLSITQRSETWRCRPEIAAFADSIFGSGWGFDTTVSRNGRQTSHDGVFLVREADVDAYVSAFHPLGLRYSANSAKKFSHLQLMNFGEAKGLGRERVMIFPTKAISDFLTAGATLAEQQAAKFYVAVTRAEQSVAIVLNQYGNSGLAYWEPSP